MKLRTPLLALLPAMLLAAGCHVGQHDQHLALDQAPPAVMDGFHREFPGLVVSHVDKLTALDGTVQYELKFRDAVHEYRRKHFSTEGVLLDSKEDVTLTTPAP